MYRFIPRYDASDIGVQQWEKAVWDVQRLCDAVCRDYTVRCVTAVRGSGEGMCDAVCIHTRFFLCRTLCGNRLMNNVRICIKKTAEKHSEIPLKTH